MDLIDFLESEFNAGRGGALIEMLAEAEYSPALAEFLERKVLTVEKEDRRLVALLLARQLLLKEKFQGNFQREVVQQLGAIHQTLDYISSLIGVQLQVTGVQFVPEKETKDSTSFGPSPEVLGLYKKS